MSLLEGLLVVFSSHPGIISFVGAFIGGDSIIIFLSALAAQNIMPIWIVFVFSFLGAFISDIAWLWLFRTKSMDFIFKKKAINKGYSGITDILTKLTRGRDFLTLFLSKFVYGTKIIIISYFGRQRISYSRFLRYNSVALLAWLLVVVFIGWATGKGVGKVVNIFDNLKKTVMLIIFIIVIIYFIRIGLEEIIFRKRNTRKRSKRCALRT